jgi:hypothetical protein
MFLINRRVVNDTRMECSVLGSVGNVYDVVIDRQPSCTCPDFEKSFNGPCKHLLFVMVRVLKQPLNSPFIYQSGTCLCPSLSCVFLLIFRVALLSTELQQLIASAPPPPADILVHASLSKILSDRLLIVAVCRLLLLCVPVWRPSLRQRAVQQKRPRHLPQCNAAHPMATGARYHHDLPLVDTHLWVFFSPICYETLKEGALTYCEHGCGNNVHKQCMQAWADSRRAAGHPVRSRSRSRCASSDRGVS